MSQHAVVIAGAGPTGMMLAAELTLAGVDVVVIERESSAERYVYRRRAQLRSGGRATRIRVVAEDELGAHEVRTLVTGSSR